LSIKEKPAAAGGGFSKFKNKKQKATITKRQVNFIHQLIVMGGYKKNCKIICR
jgi:hypothetical protein